MITEGLKTSRMKRAEGPDPAVDGLMAQGPVQPPSGAPAASAPPVSPAQGGGPPPSGATAPVPESGDPEENIPPSPDGVNHFASNALMLLHNKETADDYEAMIATGLDGAAQAAVTIGEITKGEFDKRGIQVSAQEKAEALEEIVSDVAEIGMNTNPQAFPSQPVKGQPMALHATLLKTLDMWAQKYPEDGQKIKADMEGMAGQSTPEDDAAAQQVAQFMKQQGGAPAPQSGLSPEQAQPAPAGQPMQQQPGAGPGSAPPNGVQQLL